MSYVMQFLKASVSKNVVNSSRKVIYSNFMPWEIPKRTIRWRKGLMFLRIAITTVVTHPDIIAKLPQVVTYKQDWYQIKQQWMKLFLEHTQAKIRTHQYPRAGTVQISVL